MSQEHNNELVITRTFNAPRALVWQAWTDPKHIMQWWGPAGFNNETCASDLRGQWFASMDSAHAHEFSFNEAVSLVVQCDTQAEIDYYWDKLSAVPEAKQCGWLKDQFGVSWQIVPSQMGALMGGTAQQRDRVTQAFLKMKKFDIAALKQAYDEKTIS